MIAYGVGGACETVLDGTHRASCSPSRPPMGSPRAIERFEALDLDPRRARENARRFGRERFREEMARVIDRARRRQRR